MRTFILLHHSRKSGAIFRPICPIFIQFVIKFDVNFLHFRLLTCAPVCNHSTLAQSCASKADLTVLILVEKKDSYHTEKREKRTGIPTERIDPHNPMGLANLRIRAQHTADTHIQIHVSRTHKQTLFILFFIS